MRPGAHPVYGGGGGSHQVQPISSLTPFIGNKWCIRGRVTDKSDVRTWNKPSSSGKLQSFTLVDETASIRITMYNDAVDNFSNVLKPGLVYYITGGSVKNANRRFSNVNNDYEVSLESTSIIEQCNENTPQIPQGRYNFVFIKMMPKREENSTCDVLGVVLHVAEPGRIIKKATNEELTKRTIKIADTTASVDLTLWDDKARTFNCPVGSVVAITNVRIGRYDGCSLSASQNSTIDISPNIPDAVKLAEWFQRTGGSDVPTVTERRSLGEGDGANYRGRLYIDDITSMGLGRGEKPDFIDLRCSPMYIRADNLHYDACPTCKKKVAADPMNPSVYRCDKCAVDLPAALPRYMASINVSDNISTAWVTLFNEGGEQFFGMSAKTLLDRGREDPNYINQHLRSLLFRPMLIRVRVKEEGYMGGNMGGGGGEDRVKLTATRVAFFGEKPMEGVQQQPSQQQQQGQQQQEQVQPVIIPFAKECLEMSQYAESLLAAS